VQLMPEHPPKHLLNIIDAFGPAALIGVLACDGTVIATNRSALKSSGLDATQVIGSRFEDLDPWAYSAEVRARLRASIERAARGESSRYEVEARIAGQPVFVDMTIAPVRDDSGAVAYLVASGSLVTERKQVERQVRRLNRVYAVLSEINHTLLRSSSRQATLDAACRIAVEKGEFLTAYVALAEAAGRTPSIAAYAGADEATLEIVRRLLLGDPFDCAMTHRALETGQHAVCNDIASDPLSINWRSAAMNRGYRAMASLALVVQGSVIGVLNLYAAEVGFFDVEELRLLDELALDISFALELEQREAERRQIEQALRDNEERLRQIVRLTEIGIFDHDHLTEQVYWSPEQRKIYGLSADEPVRFSRADTGLGLSTYSLIHPLDRDRLDAALKHAHEEADGLFDIEYRIIRRDGEQRWVSTRSQTFFVGEGPARRSLRTIGAVQDITERKKADRQLRLTQASVERSNTAIFWVSASGRVTYANDRACTSLGRTRAELLDMYVWDFDPDFPVARWSAMTGQMRHGQSSVSLTRHRRKDGTVFPVEATGDYVEFDGEPYIFVFAQDITERQRAERELQLLSAAVNNSHTPFFAGTPSGQMVFANEYACLSLGVSREELVGRYLWEFNPEVSPETYRQLWESLRKEGTVVLQTHHHRKDGTVIPVEITTNYFSFKGEEYSLTSALDITERSKSEEALRVVSSELIALEGESFYQLMVKRVAELLETEIALVARLRADDPDVLDTLAVLQDRSRVANFSLPAEGWAMAAGPEAVVVASGARERYPGDAYLATHGIEGIASVALRDQAGIPVGQLAAMSLRPLANPARAEAILHLFAISASAEIERQRSARRFQALFEFLPDAIVMTDRMGTISLLNRKAEVLFGWSRAELEGQGIEVLLGEQRSAWGPLADRADRALHLELPNLRVRRKDGSDFPAEISLGSIDTGDGVMITGAVRDVTDRINAERHADRARRLEAIGTLAGGIAHDLNNTLAPVLLALNAFKEQYPNDSDLLETVERSATRAAQMVRHLLSFAKGSEGQRSSLRPHRLLEDMQRLVKGTFPKNIDVRLHVSQDLPTVLGDPTQLHQVLLNLCVNARDAMPEGGTLTLEGDVVSAAEAAPGNGTGAAERPARYVVLRVCDTGIGIAPEAMERIFDPFFTTKGPESGTGLGLFTAAGIVKNHHGFIRVRSLPARGSTFSIFLPAEARPSQAAPEAPVSSSFRGAGELVLYVDDEREVCEVARTVLLRLNFTPLIASDGRSGLARALENRERLRVVITDLHMPQVDGIALVRSLRRELPGVAIIVASGRMEGATEQELNELGVRVILEKPFTEGMLRNALQAALAGTRAAYAAAVSP